MRVPGGIITAAVTMHTDVDVREHSRPKRMSLAAQLEVEIVTFSRRTRTLTMPAITMSSVTISQVVTTNSPKTRRRNATRQSVQLVLGLAVHHHVQMRWMLQVRRTLAIERRRHCPALRQGANFATNVNHVRTIECLADSCMN